MKKFSSSLMFLHACALIFVVVPFCVTAQNLVPNPSFEIKNNCPVNPVNMEDVQGWWSARNTTDYFHRCGVGSDSFIPTNIFGEQETFNPSDSAYCGFANHDNGYTYREYLQCELLSPLVVGQTYLVSFRVSLAEESQLAINNLGVRFTNIHYNDVDSPNLQAPLYNSAHVFDTNVVSEKQNWTFISGLFTADSAYTRMMIGNFFENELTTIDTLGTENKMAYYYVDDVSVTTSYIAGSPVLQNQHSLSVYPTISHQDVNITLPQGSRQFNTFNAIGQSVFNGAATPLHQAVDVSGFSEGIYFVRVQTHQGFQTAMFVVQRWNEMIFKLLMVAAGLFGIYRLPETESNFYKLMVLLQMLAIALVFFEASAVKTAGIMIFAFTALATLANAAANKDVSIKKKSIVALVALPVLSGHVFAMNHWPFATEMGIASIIPLTAYAFAVQDRSEFSVELGVLTVFAMDAAIRFFITVSGLANG